MPITHQATPDGSFSDAGRAAWTAEHTLPTADEITVTQSGSGSGSSRSVQTELRELVFNVKSGPFGATTSASATTAIQAAIDAAEASGPGTKVVYVPEGTFLCQGLATADDSKVIIRGCGAGSILKKNANGTIVTLGKQCKLENIYLDGDGANFTGVGVTISSGALEETSWRRIESSWIVNTESYGVEFSGNRSGYGSHIVNTKIFPTANTVAAIKLPTLGSGEDNGNRHFINVWSSDRPLCAIEDAVNTVIVGCDGGVPSMSADSAKLSLVGNRLVSAPGSGGWEIDGTAHSIDGNTINLAGTKTITFASTLVNSKFGPSNAVASDITITDSAPGASSGNELYYHRVLYTPSWSGTGTPPALEDGTIIGAYYRQGVNCYVDIKLTMGDETTYGNGIWTVSLPFTASRDEVMSANYSDAGAMYVGVARTAGSTSTMRMSQTVSTVNVQATAPFTWASGDILMVSGWFLIQ